MAIVNGAMITSLRKQRGWDQYELASASGIAPSVVSRLERNLQPDFKVSVVAAVAAALGVPVDSLLQLTEGTNDNQASIPELQAAIDRLEQQPERIQRHIAAIIQAYLSALEEN